MERLPYCKLMGRPCLHPEYYSMLGICEGCPIYEEFKN